MIKWISIAQLSKILEIPETTTRRYVNNFEEYFRSEKIGRGKKYHPDSVEILKKIAMLYNSDYETLDINKILANEYSFEVSNDEHEKTTQPPSYDLFEKVGNFQQRQEEFNKQLLKQLQDQQEYIKKLIMTHEKEMNEIKQLTTVAEGNEKEFKGILIEHKVKNKLEEEALVLWGNKPAKERMKSIGWFRVEEDLEKRKVFVKNYINKNFEAYLKQELDLI